MKDLDSLLEDYFQDIWRGTSPAVPEPEIWLKEQILAWHKAQIKQSLPKENKPEIKRAEIIDSPYGNMVDSSNLQKMFNSGWNACLSEVKKRLDLE